MKHIKDIVLESLLDTEKDYDVNDMLIGILFDKNIQRRRDAFSTLLKMVESYSPKQHMTTAKMKNSDSYFVEFTYPIKVVNGEATAEVLDWISYIQICKKIDEKYITIYINADEDRFGKVFRYELSWRHTQPYFNPKSSNSKLYEVPEELNELFEQIQKKASNHK